MWHRMLYVLVMVGLGLRPSWSQADMFDNARNALRMQGAHSDMSGVTARGGVNLSTGAPPQGTTLLRGHANIGIGCGAMDFGPSLKEALDEIPAIIEGMTQQLIQSMPLLVLCYASPSLCDLAKHWQSLINALIQARYGQCHTAQNAAMFAGLRLRGGEVSRCLEEQGRSGATVSQALRICNDSPSFLRRPDGSRGVEVRLIADTMAAAGASQEMQTLAPALLGEITLQAGNGLGFASGRPQAALHGRYAHHKAQAEMTLQAAVEELQTTGTVREETLRAASIPGKPLSRAAVEALAALRKDPTRYETHVGQMSTASALAKLTWECGEIEEQLTAAIEGNAHLSDAERALLEKRYQALRRNLAQFMAQVDVIEKYDRPAVDALMRDYTAVQEAATQFGLRAPAVQITPSRYQRQLPMGYSR